MSLLRQGILRRQFGGQNSLQAVWGANWGASRLGSTCHHRFSLFGCWVSRASWMA
jgi:hypothetical protein